MRTNKLYIGVFLALVAGALFWGIKVREGAASQDGTKDIHAQLAAIQTYISSTGDVLPKNRLEIRPPVGGRVEEVLVKEGEKVKAGQIVAWMSSTDRAALLDAARGKGDDALAYWRDVYKPVALVAPIDGEVIVATMQPGQTVTAADPVLVISDKLIFRAQVDETDIGKISIGQEALVTLDAYQDVRIKATVDHVYFESKTVNNVTIYEVDLKAEELPAFCRSGMNVTVDFKAAGKENILTLPVDAIKNDKDGTYVMVRDRGKKEPQRRAVIAGITDDARVEIVSGLTSEDTIVVKSRKFSLPKNAAGTNPFAPARPAGGGGGGHGPH
jgi:macrolide-specific efflux system membrane fusion protein